MSFEPEKGQDTMSDPRVVLDGLAFPESPRWHDGHIYVSDWGAHEAIKVVDGNAVVVARGTAFPMCIDFLSDGRLLLLDGTALLVQEADGTLSTYSDLTGVSPLGFNDLTVDSEDNVFVNCVGFEFGVGEPKPGLVAVVTPDGQARTVAESVMFPNGMAVVDRTLVVAESYANCLTAFDIGAGGQLSSGRTWAALDGGVPDGISADPEGRVWYADVPNRCCVLVSEGGEVHQRIDLDRGAFSCALGEQTLYVATNAWTGIEGLDPEGRNGQLLAVTVR